MDKKIIIFGNIDVEKHKFHQYKNAISIYDLNIDRIVVSNKVPFSKKCYMYMNKVPFSKKCYMYMNKVPFSKKYYMYMNKYMYFLIKYSKLLAKYN